jgi:hypothetical protein
MDDKEYLQCSNGCLAYVHVGCGNGDSLWECLECKQKVTKEPDVPPLVSCDSDDIAAEAAKAEAERYQSFEEFSDCHAILRLRKFRTRNTFYNSQNVVTGVTYACKKCKAHFIVRHNLENSRWQVPEHDHKVGTSFHHKIAVCGCTPITDPPAPLLGPLRIQESIPFGRAF